MASFTAQGRTALTLGILIALFVGGIAWAWSQVTDPFPERLEIAKCEDLPVQVGERVRPQQVTVTVLNASERNGLAGETMDELVAHGFGEGDRGNAPPATATAAAVIWASPDDPAARLVRSYLGKDVRIVEQPEEYPGITIVVGKKFDKVTKGRNRVRAKTEGTVCTPTQTEDPDIAEPPA